MDDGIAFLRSFSQIVIHPDCVHTLDEANRYSFKVDRLTGSPLPEVEDRHNHCVDSLRYGLSPLIRNQHSGSYFLRSALLVQGETVVPPISVGRPDAVYATAAICERDGSAVGLIFWAVCQYQEHLLTVLDYDVVELEEACSPAWFARTFARLQELREEWNPIAHVSPIKIEAGPLYSALGSGFQAYVLQNPAILAGMHAGARPPIDLEKIKTEKLPVGLLAQRAESVRTAVNSGSLAKLSRTAYTREVTHRSVTGNHLTSQILGYRPGADAAQELAAAFVLGCLEGKLRDRRKMLPATAAPPPVAPAVAAAAATEEQRQAARTERLKAHETALREWEEKRSRLLAEYRQRIGDPSAFLSAYAIHQAIGKPPQLPGFSI